MRLLLFVLGCFVFILGISMFMHSGQPLHEIEAFILFLISSVLITGAAIIDSMFYMLRRIRHFIKESN